MIGKIEEDIKLLKKMIQEAKDKNEKDVKLVKEMQVLVQEAIECIAICPICHKKYVKGQSENGCPYCEIRCLVEDTI